MNYSPNLEGWKRFFFEDLSTEAQINSKGQPQGIAPTTRP